MIWEGPANSAVSPPNPMTATVLGVACPNVFMARVSAGGSVALFIIKMITL